MLVRNSKSVVRGIVNRLACQHWFLARLHEFLSVNKLVCTAGMLELPSPKDLESYLQAIT